MEAHAEGIPPATASCYSAGLRVRVTPRAGLLQASRPTDAGDISTFDLTHLINTLKAHHALLDVLGVFLCSLWSSD